MDDTISLEKAMSLLSELGGEAREKLRPYLEGLKEAGKETVRFGDITNNISRVVSDALRKAAESVGDLVKSFGSFSQQAEEISNTITGFFDSAFNSINEFAEKSNLGVTELAIALEPAIGLIDKSITGMGHLGDSGYEAGSKITTAFAGVAPLFEKVFKSNSGEMKLFTAMTEGASRAVGLERELINMALAQGRAASVTDESNERFKDMNQSYMDYVNMSIMAARETGQTVGSLMDLNKALSSIPGSLDSAEETVKASRMAAAAGLDQLAVAKQLSEMYTRLGTNEKDAIEAMAYMHDKAGDSKLRMEAFNSTVLAIAGSFKMLGDNTNATTNFVNAFDKAFQDSKISPDAMREVITSVGQGIERMDVAKKAFVSSSTGGPGGLAGSFQMDYAIQEGHVDQVVQKTMMAMQSQFGGQVVTLKDAAENPALAGELYKQVQYLTQVAGIAKDDKEAYRVLEAMKSGVTDMLKPGSAEGEKGLALDRQLNKGAVLQEQTKNKLMDIHQTLEATRLRQDDIYHTLLVQIPDTSEKAISFMNSSAEFGDRGSVGAGVRSMAQNKPGETGFESYQKPEWTGMMANSLGLEGMIENAGSNIHSVLSGLSGKRGPVSAERNVANSSFAMQPPPGDRSGISNITPGHRQDLGIPELPKLTLPTAKENDGINLPTIEHKFEDATVHIVLDTGENDKKLLRTIKLQIEADDSKKKRQSAIGL